MFVLKLGKKGELKNAFIHKRQVGYVSEVGTLTGRGKDRRHSFESDAETFCLM